VATIGESQGIGAGPAGLTGAAGLWPPAAAAGLGGVADGVADSGGGGLALTFSEAEVDWTELLGFSALGLLPPSGGVGEVGLVSSGIAGKVQISGAADSRKNLNL